MKGDGTFPVFPMPHRAGRKKSRTTAQVMADLMCKNLEPLIRAGAVLYLSCPPKYSHVWERELNDVAKRVKMNYLRVSKREHNFYVDRSLSHPMVLEIMREE